MESKARQKGHAQFCEPGERLRFVSYFHISTYGDEATMHVPMILNYACPSPPNAAKPGAYQMEITVKRNDQVLYRQSRGLTVGYSDELRIWPCNEALLESIAAASGGVYSPGPSEVFDTHGRTATRPTPFWPYLTTASVLLLVLDVALRRIDFSLHWPIDRSRV